MLDNRHDHASMIFGQQTNKSHGLMNLIAIYVTVARLDSMGKADLYSNKRHKYSTVQHSEYCTVQYAVDSTVSRHISKPANNFKK